MSSTSQLDGENDDLVESGAAPKVRPQHRRKLLILSVTAVVAAAATLGTLSALRGDTGKTAALPPPQQSAVLTGRTCTIGYAGGVLVGSELRSTGPDSIKVYRVVGTASADDRGGVEARFVGASLTECDPPAASTTVLALGATVWVTTAWTSCPDIVSVSVDYLTGSGGGTLYVQTSTTPCTTRPSQ